MARRILVLGPYPYDGGQLTFRAMPRGPRHRGAQLVSESIRFLGPDEKHDSWWSVRATSTCRTTCSTCWRKGSTRSRSWSVPLSTRPWRG
ncbi:hypothetical protein [Streptomyces asiaticus]|uniref:hypothetical protein n=1 Tax=Streptomyces asiaticus TaxID=114695 RepID=UPI00374DA5C7